MIENQSDNIDNKENDISDLDNVPEDSQISEHPIIDNDESSSPNFPMNFDSEPKIFAVNADTAAEPPNLLSIPLDKTLIGFFGNLLILLM